MKIEVSTGEVLDKFSILEIKLERIKDSEKVKNIKIEMAELEPHVNMILEDAKVKDFYENLKGVNSRLWDIEDLIRECERRGDFGPSFIELARAVYYTNDRRSEIKRSINLHTGSHVIEEKSYQKY